MFPRRFSTYLPGRTASRYRGKQCTFVIFRYKFCVLRNGSVLECNSAVKDKMYEGHTDMNNDFLIPISIAVYLTAFHAACSFLLLATFL